MNRKVLIVDDSALMRKFHKQALEQVGFITDFARNGEECLQQLDEFCPHVIILDINMPVMDGLTCLKEIMRKRPTPVVMVSSLTLQGATASLDALALGAVDYIEKPSGTFSFNMGELSGAMVQKVTAAANIDPSTIARQISRSLHAAKTRVDSPGQKCVKQAEIVPAKHASFDLIVIGVSTGGPNCLQTILPSLRSNFPTPIVIAQHMPGRFTKVFSERLNALCDLKVIEVTEEQKIYKGHIYIAQGDGDIIIDKSGATLVVKPVESDKNYLWHPSVSKLVNSAMSCITPKKLCCVQLTGMGNDGAEEMHKAHSQGATTIAESEETAVIFGMPGQLVKSNGATHVAPNYLISALLA
jgi:two-component system chemotaxis response regulator CheB